MLPSDVWDDGGYGAAGGTRGDRVHQSQVLHQGDDRRVHGPQGELPCTDWEVCVCVCVCLSVCLTSDLTPVARSEDANKSFSAAVQLHDSLVKAWALWGDYLDQLFAKDR